MFSEYFAKTTQLTSEDIHHIDSLVDQSMGDIEVEEKNFLLLKNLLQEKDDTQLFVMRNSYARWYASYGWDLSQGLAFVDFDILVSRYAFAGLLLEWDVWKIIMTYLHNRSLDESDMGEKYGQLKKGFFNSSEIMFISKNTNTPYTVRQCVTDILSVEQKADAIEQSEFFSQLQVSVEARILESESGVDSFDVVNKLRGLVNFFQGIEADTVWYAVEPYFYPQLFKDDVRSNEDDKSSSIGMKNSNEIAVSESEVKKSTYTVIHESILKEITTLDNDARDEYIITKLSELAQKYGDESINDLYYFDEQQGVFVWNDTLLSDT